MHSRPSVSSMGHRPENLPPSFRDPNTRPNIYAAPYESTHPHSSSMDGLANDFAELGVQSVRDKRRSFPVCSIRICSVQCTQFRGFVLSHAREAICHDRSHLWVSPINMQMGSFRLSISLHIPMVEGATNTTRDSPSSILRIQRHFQTPTSQRTSRLPH